MVKFRCKRSGNTVSFSLDHDIEGLRKHEGYEEIKDEIKTESSAKEINTEKSSVDCSSESKDGNDERETWNDERKDERQKDAVLKQRGRPRKK